VKPSLIYFLDKFPCYSETFVLDQIIGLIQRGFDVKIVALSQDPRPLPVETDQLYQLSQRCVYLLPPAATGTAGKLVQRLKLIGQGLHKKAVWRVLAGNLGGAAPRSFLASILATNAQQYRADMLICHFGTTATLAMHLQQADVLAGKILPVFHGFDLSEQQVLAKYQQDYLQLFKHCPAVFAISRLWCARLAELGCPTEKINLLRTGVALQNFAFSEPQSTLQLPVKLLSVARLTEKKGLQYAIDAVALLKQRGIAIQYHIIGDGPLRPTLEAQITALGLSAQVQLCGVQPAARVVAALKNSDVFVLPSVTAANGDMEGIPVSLMEAMASGVLCLSTYHSGIPELICHAESGFLVPERNAVALAQQLQSVIEGHYALAEIRLKAREKIVSEFNQQQIYDQLAAFLQDEHNGVH